MPRLRIALAQMNPTVGDLSGNTRLVLEWTRRAIAGGAQVVVFPHLSLSGYPIEDLARRATFTRAARQHLEELATLLEEAGCGEALVVVGFPDRSESTPRDAVAAVHRGEIVAEQYRNHLSCHHGFAGYHPVPADRRLDVVRLHDLDIGIVVDEDGANLAQESERISALGTVGADLIVVPGASAYRRSTRRLPLLMQRAAQAGVPLAYTNLVGGQDDLVFDGGSLVVDAHGEVWARAEQFDEQLLLVDADLPAEAPLSGEKLDGWLLHHHVLETGPLPPRPPLPGPAISEPLSGETGSDEAEVWAALVTGLRDYVRKNRFRSVILGFSGGIDSALVAALAVDALGPDAVHGVAMPSKYSSEHSRSDAAELARRLGCHFRIEPVADLVHAYVDQLHLAGTGVAEENIQARVRGMLLMALSNVEGHLVLAPGNKTELAVGYSTIYGDAVGGFAPIKDVFKTQVWALARWRNAEADKHGRTPPIPENSITKPPSAELRPDQRDTDSLPDYPLLDGILDGYLEGVRSYDDLLAASFDTQTVDRIVHMVDRAEYKRRQYPMGTMITSGVHGRHRALPTTNAWREGR